MSNEHFYDNLLIEAASKINNEEFQEPESKRVKVNEPKMIDSTAEAKENVKQIRKYWTVPKSEFTLVPRRKRGVSRILVPYATYPYEPQLFLAHIGGTKFEYRYRTLEDLNTSLHPVIKEPSSSPKPPHVWCLQCGEAFKKSNYANSHSKNKHQNPYPAYKTSYFLKLDM